jgi:hypothetical protein
MKIEKEELIRELERISSGLKSNTMWNVKLTIKNLEKEKYILSGQYTMNDPILKCRKLIVFYTD